MSQPIPAEILIAIEAHALSDLKNEVCGLVYRDQYLRLSNATLDPICFEADPAELASALAKHGDPWVIFHTHPNGVLQPSGRDLNCPYYNNSIMMIGRIVWGRLEYRMFRVSNGTYEVIVNQPNTNSQKLP